MVDTFKTVLDLGSQWLLSNVRTLFAILRSPPDFMASQDWDNNPPLVPASTFAVFISMLNLVIHLPQLRTIEVEVESPSFVLADTVLTYGFWFLYGSVFHMAARMLRGHRNYQATLSCFLYMTAFYPIISLVSIPAALFINREMIHGVDTSSLSFYLKISDTLFSRPPMFLSTLLLLLATMYFFFSMVSAMRTVHQVGRFRAFLIAATGFAVMFTTVPFIEAPAVQMLWVAFVHHA